MENLNSEQIEELDELTSAIYEAAHRTSVINYRWIAEELQRQGYRKSTDVAREIFEELEKYLVTSCTIYTQAVHAIGVGTFARLKKKYTEEQK